MAIYAPSRTRVRFAAAVLSAVCTFHAVAHAASPVRDGVSLTESTITWSTVKYGRHARTQSSHRARQVFIEADRVRGLAQQLRQLPLAVTSGALGTRFFQLEDTNL
jgi:hypothetical protein